MGPAEKIKKVKQNPSKGVGCFLYPLEIIQTYDDCNFQLKFGFKIEYQ